MSLSTPPIHSTASQTQGTDFQSQQNAKLNGKSESGIRFYRYRKAARIGLLEVADKFLSLVSKNSEARIQIHSKIRLLEHKILCADNFLQNIKSPQTTKATTSPAIPIANHPLTQNADASKEADNTWQYDSIHPSALRHQLTQKLGLIQQKLDQLNPEQLMHLLAWLTFITPIPVDIGEKSLAAINDIMNYIDGERNYYHLEKPKINDELTGLSYYKIFDNVFREALIDRLPKSLRDNFTKDDKFLKNKDSLHQIQEKIRNICSQQLDSYRGNPVPAQPAKMSDPGEESLRQTLAPLCTQIDDWNQQERYAALFHMLRGDIRYLDQHIKTLPSMDRAKQWTRDVENIRRTYIDRPGINTPLEQKKLFNEILRSALTDKLPDDFKDAYNRIWDNFNDSKSPENLSYDHALDASRKLIVNHMTQ